MKQYNIFGSIDHLSEDGEIKRCEICNKSIEKGDLCDSEDCQKEWLDKFIINGLK